MNMYNYNEYRSQMWLHFFLLISGRAKHPPPTWLHEVV